MSRSYAILFKKRLQKCWFEENCSRYTAVVVVCFKLFLVSLALIFLTDLMKKWVLLDAKIFLLLQKGSSKYLSVNATFGEINVT